MSAITLIVSKQGRAALTNAERNGTAPVTIASIGVTATSFTATDTTTALPSEIKRITTLSGGATAADTLHVTIRDDSADSYSVRGFALYLADGTLFASYGQATDIMQKSSQATMLTAGDVQFTDIKATSLTFGDTNFQLNAATTEKQGVSELATSDETIAGTDTQRTVTPAGLLAALNARLGAGAPSTFVKSLLTAATATAFRVLLSIKNAASYDIGHGNGLDADTLDGIEGANYTRADLTTLGKTGNIVSDSATNTAALWSALPVGYARMMNGVTIGTAGGVPASATGYFLKVGNRDVSGGWAGLWTQMTAAGNSYVGFSADASTLPTWKKLWTEANFDPSSKLDATATAAAATKLANVRAFALSGPVTATAVNFDGTGNVTLTTAIADGALSIAKTTGLQGALDGKLAKDGNAVSATTAGLLTVADTRATADVPGDFADSRMRADLKNVVAAGSPPVGSSKAYVQILTVNGWKADGSAGWATQLSVGDGLAVRQGLSATTWGAWRTLWHDGNFTPADKLDATATASAAAKLATARAFALSGPVTATAINFDGTDNVTLQTAIADGALSIAKTTGLQGALDGKIAIGGAAADYLTKLSTYVPQNSGVDANTLAAGTKTLIGTTGNTNVPSLNGETYVFIETMVHYVASTLVQRAIGYVNGQQATRSLYNGTWSPWRLVWDSVNFTPSSKLDTTATAVAATKLATARSFSLTGPVTAVAANFDGTGNVTLTTAVADGALSIAKTAGLQGALDGKQASLGFTPVQQGTGTNQGTNAIKIGWGNSNAPNKILVTVDASDMGAIAMENWVYANYLSNVGGVVNWVGIGQTDTSRIYQDGGSQNLVLRTGSAAAGFKYSIFGAGGTLSLPALAAAGAITGASIRSTGTIMAAGGFQIG